jgi:signal transduction histidine kinase
VGQAGEGILLVDVGTKRVREASAAYRGMLGYAPEEISPLTLYDLVPYSREAMDCSASGACGRARPASAPSGATGARTARWSRRRGEDERDLLRGKEALCGVVRDITERKRAEEALREVREGERNRMVRNLHDGALQNLAYALAEAQIIRVLSEDPGLDGRLDDRIGALRRTERPLHVVYNTCAWARGNRPLAGLLETLVDESRRMFTGCEVRPAVDGGPPEAHPAEGDVEVLRILREPLSNARRHSGAGKVLVAGRAKGTDVVMRCLG